MALPTWYFKRGDTVIGPVHEKRLLEMLKDGSLTSETPVSSTDMPDWKPVGQLFSTGKKNDELEPRTHSEYSVNSLIRLGWLFLSIAPPSMILFLFFFRSGLWLAVAIISAFMGGGALWLGYKASLTKLMRAAGSGNIEQVKALLENGADVEEVDSNGQTALFYAACNGHDHIVTLLLDHGADLNRSDPGSSKGFGVGDTPLSLAAENGHADVVDTLLARGARLNAGKRYPLMSAVKGHNYSKLGMGREQNSEEPAQVIMALLKAGANVNYVERHGGITPIICASLRGHTIVVKALLEAGADINHADNEGHTALILASEYKRVEVVKILLENGADVNHADNAGRTALKEALSHSIYAEDAVGKTIERMLREHGAAK